MPEDRRHESADLQDYEVLDGSDTLQSRPADDPLDRGVVAPVRWSAGMRFGTTAAEQNSGPSLERRLAMDEPDPGAEGAEPNDGEPDENALEDDVERDLLDEGPDPRTGRLQAANDGTFPVDPYLVGRDAGIDGGGATAEEAAIHMLTDAEIDLHQDHERRSGWLQ
jgi:Family of unknown function (DUF5709)